MSVKYSSTRQCLILCQFPHMIEDGQSPNREAFLHQFAASQTTADTMQCLSHYQTLSSLISPRFSFGIFCKRHAFARRLKKQEQACAGIFCSGSRNYSLRSVVIGDTSTPHKCYNQELCLSACLFSNYQTILSPFDCLTSATCFEPRYKAVFCSPYFDAPFKGPLRHLRRNGDFGNKNTMSP